MWGERPPLLVQLDACLIGSRAVKPYLSEPRVRRDITRCPEVDYSTSQSESIPLHDRGCTARLAPGRVRVLVAPPRVQGRAECNPLIGNIRLFGREANANRPLRTCYLASNHPSLCRSSLLEGETAPS